MRALVLVIGLLPAACSSVGSPRRSKVAANPAEPPIAAAPTAPSSAALATPPPKTDPTKPGFHRLGAVPSCSIKGHLDALNDCTRLAGRALGVADTSREAFDNDACTVWNSGEFPPQEVSVDLIDAPGLDALLVYPEMTPSTADVTHMVEISDDGESYRPLAILTGVMTTGEGYALRLPRRIATRYLRLRTTASPSWVAWREITPLVCARDQEEKPTKQLVSSFEDLGPISKNACQVDSNLLGPHCQRIGSRSTAPAGSERAVFDGDLCNSWDSGELPPRAVTGALIRPTVSAVLLAPASVPEGQAVDVTHVVEVSANGTHYRPIAIVSGPMESGHLYALRWPEPAAAVFVRVRTTASPSRVAWREIAVFSCEGGR